MQSTEFEYKNYQKILCHGSTPLTMTGGACFALSNGDDVPVILIEVEG